MDADSTKTHENDIVHTTTQIMHLINVTFGGGRIGGGYGTIGGTSECGSAAAAKLL